jgi:hypothetical protein
MSRVRVRACREVQSTSAFDSSLRVQSDGPRRKLKLIRPGHATLAGLLHRTERFLLTAADQKDGSRSDRLARVIHAKFEAGLLRPYNHVAGYTRLMKWMADK